MPLEHFHNRKERKAKHKFLSVERLSLQLHHLKEADDGKDNVMTFHPESSVVTFSLGQDEALW